MSTKVPERKDTIQVRCCECRALLAIANIALLGEIEIKCKRCRIINSVLFTPDGTLYTVVTESTP